MDGISPGRTVSALRSAQATSSPSGCCDLTATTRSKPWQTTARGQRG